MRAIRIHEHGGPEKLNTDDVPEPHPSTGEVRIAVEAVGLNFIDIYNRTGLYPIPLPSTIGTEAAGKVVEVGPGVTDFRVGDHVASARVSGAYAQSAIIPVAGTVRVPEGISLVNAAAVMLQGMTAHYLATDTFPLKTGDVALVHAAAGGVGLLLTQIAKKRGARVIGIVGSDEKVQFSRKAGADDVIVSTRENFAEATRRLTSGRGVDVAYDAVGKDTFEGTLASLRPRGMFVSFGNASGAIGPFSPLILSQKGSLFFTRPTLGHYTATREELQRRADDLFRWMLAGELDLRIGATFPLDRAADAHRALESRKTTGKVLLIP